jgi:hypothetical protein
MDEPYRNALQSVVMIAHPSMFRPRWQPVGLKESQRKSDWVKADFADFEGQ